jgi:hypothetical protein
MKIYDLEHSSSAFQAQAIEGGAFASASSRSVASAGFSSSSFSAIAIGKSSTLTSTNVKLSVFSKPYFSSSFASAQTLAFARD